MLLSYSIILHVDCELRATLYDVELGLFFPTTLCLVHLGKTVGLVETIAGKKKLAGRAV